MTQNGAAISRVALSHQQGFRTVVLTSGDTVMYLSHATSFNFSCLQNSCVPCTRQRFEPFLADFVKQNVRIEVRLIVWKRCSNSYHKERNPCNAEAAVVAPEYPSTTYSDLLEMACSLRIAKGVSVQRTSLPSRSALRVACVARPQRCASKLSMVKATATESKQIDWTLPTVALLAPFFMQVNESMAKGGELGILGETD